MLNRSIIYLCIPFLIFGCSSARLVEHWTNPDTSSQEIHKVLIIGITHDTVSRMEFESSLVSSLRHKRIFAVRSIDFFEESFTEVQKTEEELNKIEEQLFEAGFDGIILSKVIGSESRVTLVRAINMLNRDFRNFREDYLQNQELYRMGDQYETSKIIHTETALYCICPGTERELVWSAAIDLIAPSDRERSIHDYVHIVTRALEESSIPFVQH